MLRILPENSSKALNHADVFKEEVRPAVHFSYLGSVISGAKIGAM
jgi:hypothetical protein